MERNINEGGITLRELLRVIKKNIILLLVIVLLASMSGLVYANAQKPNYTAGELVFFKAHNEKGDETINNINIMQSYVDTIVDFCDEGVVIDRANFYYSEFVKQQSTKDGALHGVNLEEFLKNIDSVKTEYDNGAKSNINYFSSSRVTLITTKADTLTGQKSFSFSVCYTEDDKLLAYNMVRILVVAYSDECLALDGSGARKYFNGVEVEIIDEGSLGISTNVSKGKTILLFTAIGVVLALIVVYTKNFLDNTIKTKEDLEMISGLNVLAVINEQEGARYDK